MNGTILAGKNFMDQPVLAPPGTKADFVYRTLHAEIMGGALPPGQRLRLQEIAARYATSEMPVREALRRLQADGLVVFENHRGATVSAVPLTRVVEIIATRTFLEVLAISEATPFHTRESLLKAQKINDELKKTKDSKRSSELNREFHVVLYEPCPNTFLKQEIDMLWDKVWSTQQRSVFERAPARVKGAADEHTDIVEALASGSVAAVRKAAMSHRERTLESWKAQLVLTQPPAPRA
jgi:DNA-binding GntR family transcriptional regulator